MTKNKFYYLVLVAGLVLITTSIVRKDKEDDDDDILNLDKDVKLEETAGTENVSGKNYLEGVLYKSEDSKLGDLKLSSGEGDIYIRTSRDFSALVGFQVLVLIDGNKDKFELVDIQSKVAKDGFIIQQ